jgi:uncharacterized protein YydD (DUF2326 family)
MNVNTELPKLQAKREELERRVARDREIFARKHEIFRRSSMLLADCNRQISEAWANDVARAANNPPTTRKRK